ncbi:hypothetical protein FB451DRAFT_581593 [Mycena latifolia]|nr:hypothetical protein FB451DRAFT_581593 [Mycena latifolia]
MSILGVWTVCFVRRPGHSLWRPLRVSSRPYTIEANEMSAPRKQGPKPKTIISTLTPSRLKPSDYLDLSHSRSIAPAFPASRSASGDQLLLITYGYRSQNTRIPFPANTRGFLYYRSGHPLAPLSGSIRFRLTLDDSPSSFARGTDLMGPSGFPWRILLAQVACRRSYTWIAEQLVHENLVTQQQLSQCRDLFGQKNRIFPEYTLFHLDSAFLVNFSSPVTLTVVGEELYDMKLDPLRQRLPTSSFTWSGSAIARFEPSVLSEHAGRRVVHIRILKIVNSVTCMDAVTDTGRILRPEEGELLTVRFYGRLPAPWTHDIDRPYPNSPVSIALRALWDISRPR